MGLLLLIPAPLRVSDRFGFLFPLIFISSGKFAFLSARTRNSRNVIMSMSLLVYYWRQQEYITTGTRRGVSSSSPWRLQTRIPTKLISAVLFTQSCVEWSRLMDFLITLGFCINKNRECRELQVVVGKMLGWYCVVLIGGQISPSRASSSL